MPFPFNLIFPCIIALLAFSILLFLLKRYKKCPSDKVMVIYGKVGSNKDGSARSAKCIHGGAAFVWPVIQAYEFLDLTPLSISVDLENALSRQNIRINVPSRFTVGISTETGVMQNAAERLLGLRSHAVACGLQRLARLALGALRIAAARSHGRRGRRTGLLPAVRAHPEVEPAPLAAHEGEHVLVGRLGAEHEAARAVERAVAPLAYAYPELAVVKYRQRR